jgi:type IV pilus assembly protein PilB
MAYSEGDSAPAARLDHTYFENEVRPYLGAVLLRSRLLKPEQLDLALDEQRRTRKRLGQILVERGWVFPPDVARALALQHGLDYVDIQYSSVDARAAARLSPEIGQRHCAIPVRFLGSGEILVAVADPTTAALADVRAALGESVVFAVAEETDVRNAWRALLNGYRP